MQQEKNDQSVFFFPPARKLFSKKKRKLFFKRSDVYDNTISVELRTAELSGLNPSHLVALSPFKQQVQSPYQSMSDIIFRGLQRWVIQRLQGTPQITEYTDQLQGNFRVEA